MSSNGDFTNKRVHCLGHCRIHQFNMTLLFLSFVLFLWPFTAIYENKKNHYSDINEFRYPLGVNYAVLSYTTVALGEAEKRVLEMLQKFNITCAEIWNENNKKETNYYYLWKRMKDRR